MKQIYIMWNYDCDQPVIASEDKDLLNEYMCDFFIEDAYYDFCYRCYYGLVSIDNPISAVRLVNQVWEDDLNYYLDYFDILGNDLVVV